MMTQTQFLSRSAPHNQKTTGILREYIFAIKYIRGVQWFFLSAAAPVIGASARHAVHVVLRC